MICINTTGTSSTGEEVDKRVALFAEGGDDERRQVGDLERAGDNFAEWTK